MLIGLALGLAAGDSDVDEGRLRATVERLAAFQTRNTSAPELEAAAAWVAGEFRKLPGMKVELFRYPIVAGPRVPEAKTVVEVVATLPGRTDRRVVIGGHLDSINMHAGPLDGPAALAARAPGANDDASGVALTLEAARLMSGRTWNATLVFVAFSGEEEGLLGSAALARHAKAEGWSIEGVLSNDMVGNSADVHGHADDREVRCFSEERATHSSRELARYVEWLQNSRRERLFFDPALPRKRVARPKFGVKLVFRKDRFGRGGDHSSFNAEGFSAVRFTDVYEEWSRQHTPADLPEFVDYGYLANNARVNILAASALASAEAPPARVRVVRDQSQDTTLEWRGSPDAEYVVYWRATTSPVWQSARPVRGLEAVIKDVNKDDQVFGVGSPGGVPVEAE